jgi:Fe-S-cluster containining protein
VTADDSTAPWYAEGLRFGGTRCGNCCNGPGSVRVSDAEIVALAAEMDVSEHAFRAMYTRRLRGGDVSLREKRSKACVFYEPSRGCTVYAARPRQCRTWPFWRGVVHSAERWDEEAQACPGMNRGALHAADAIATTAAADGTSGSVPERTRRSGRS